MKRTLKGAAIIIIIFIALLIIIPRVINIFTHPDNSNELTAWQYTQEEVASNYDNIPSDIDGWTMGDKFRAGLQPIEGVDSDGDGLSDKEEIEVYGSDPAKASTAGDLYTDGYKIENGMDVNKYYDRSDISFDSNECSEVILTADTVSDLNAHISKKDNLSLDGYTVYKTYEIYSYSGKVSLDVTDVVNNNDGVKAKDLSILIGHWYGGEMWSSKLSYSDNVVTLDYDFDPNQTYIIAVAKKSGLFAPSKPAMKLSFNSDDGDIVGEANFLYVHTFSFRNFFMDTKPRLYYVPTGDSKTDSNTIQYLLAISYYVVDGYHLGDLSDADVQAVSEARMTALKTIMKSFPFFRINEAEPKIGPKHLFLVWNDEVMLDSSTYKATVSSAGVTSSSHTGFNVADDAFTFPNFSTQYTPGGSCAGIALYTARLYNNRTAASHGEVTSDKLSTANSLSWDISNDSENDTLTDEGIGDYKSSSFTKDHKNDKGIMSDLSAGENEFIKMIASHWAEANDQMDSINHLYYISDETGVYSWEMIKQMEAELNKGNIIILGMADSNGGGHAINVVDYKTADNGNTVYFTLYDNNYPLNMKGSKSVNNVLKVVRKEYQQGVADSFSYYYKPYDDSTYEYNSEFSNAGFKCFQVMDSNLNILD